MRSAVLGLVAVAIVGEVPVYAYLDPGTGSMVLQAALGMIAATIVAVRVYWSRVKAFLVTRRASRG